MVNIPFNHNYTVKYQPFNFALDPAPALSTLASFLSVSLIALQKKKKQKNKVISIISTLSFVVVVCVYISPQSFWARGKSSNLLFGLFAKMCSHSLLIDADSSITSNKF